MKGYRGGIEFNFLLIYIENYHYFSFVLWDFHTWNQLFLTVGLGEQ